MMGECFDIKRFAVHDGPGIRTTVFLKGCPLSCRWCQNPEGMRPGAELCFSAALCGRCRACADACPAEAIQPGPAGPLIDRQRCTNCGVCAAACRHDALEMKGETCSAAQVVEAALADEVFYQTSGGGLTLSGGDPLFQPQFAYAILSLAQEKGLHTAVETCLFAPPEVVEALSEVVDLWLVDLKLFDAGQHLAMTGQSNRPILENYRRLAKGSTPVHTRIPIIPGCTDASENLRALGRFVVETAPDSPVEPIFYNPLAAGKYAAFGKSFRAASEPYTEAGKEEVRSILAETGVHLIM